MDDPLVMLQRTVHAFTEELPNRSATVSAVAAEGSPGRRCFIGRNRDRLALRRRRQIYRRPGDTDQEQLFRAAESGKAPPGRAAFVTRAASIASLCANRSCSESAGIGHIQQHCAAGRTRLQTAGTAPPLTSGETTSAIDSRAARVCP